MVRSVFAALVIQRRGWQTLFSLWNFKRRFSAEVRCEKQRSGTKREGGRVPRPWLCVSLPALGRTGRGTPWPQGHIWETFPQRVTGEDRCFLRLKLHIGLASTHGAGRPRNCLQRRLVAPGNLRLSMLRFGFQQKISFHGFLALTCSLVAALAAGERSPEGSSVPSDTRAGGRVCVRNQEGTRAWLKVSEMSRSVCGQHLVRKTPVSPIVTVR